MKGERERDEDFRELKFRESRRNKARVHGLALPVESRAQRCFEHRDSQINLSAVRDATLRPEIGISTSNTAELAFRNNLPSEFSR